MDSCKTIEIEFGFNSTLKGYVVDGSVYYGKSDISGFLGLSKNWAGRTIGKDTKAGNYLSENGYIDHTVKLSSAIKGGATSIDLVSGEQLSLLVTAGAISGSITAITLLASAFNEVRVNRERDALGLEPLRMSELKESFDLYRERYYKWFAASLTEDEWKAGDKVNPTPADVELWAGKVKEVYKIQAANSSVFVIEAKDKAVDYEDMIADYV